MRETWMQMTMPITVEIVDKEATVDAIKKVFAYFEYVEEKFSVYRNSSEITRINKGELEKAEYSADMVAVLASAEKTKIETKGFFDIKKTDGTIDPSGIVKGWAIYQAAKILQSDGYKNFYVDAGGDVQVEGLNEKGEKWRVGIRNPFSNEPNKAFVKLLAISNCGVATSGNYIRGNHIYNPQQRNIISDELVSLTVIGSNVYEADRFATAAFAMGDDGINFIESLSGFEGYSIDRNGEATLTTGFANYCIPI